MGQLLLAFAAAEEIHDTEFGLRVEAPVLDTPSVVETARGEGEGEQQLHFGWEATFSYALTSEVYLTGLVGARRSFGAFDEVDGSFPFLITRQQRLMLGLKYSFTSPPTFPYLSLHAGFVGSWWRVEVYGLDGDRVDWGPTLNAGVGVDHFLNPRWAVNVEARPWFERAEVEYITLDPWAFESPPFRAGFSVLVGIIRR